MNKIKKGDEVIITTGKDKGKRGSVLNIANDRVLVESCNMAKKHVKPNPNAGESGGIIEKEMPLHMSNVALFNPATGKGDRVGCSILPQARVIESVLRP